MNIRTFSPDDYQAIIDVHNSLHIVWPERPRTPQAWAEVDQHRSSKCKHQRLVAVENGRVVGFASYDQSPWSYPPQSFYVNVEVFPAHQHNGIGTALYDQVMAGLQEFSPPALRADAFTNLPQGFTFLQKRGFYEAFRETPVHLDVASFDASSYADLEPKLNSQGIFIKTVTELKPDPNRDRKIYELMCTVDEDVPHEGDQITEPDFDDWAGWGLNSPSVLQDAFLIAVHGDQYVGLRDLGNYADREALLGSLLGVRRDYRKRGIALAMQLRNIAYAREHHYRLLKDCTAIQNVPMQALFNQLGFVRDPE
jgi:mycothiol synthase